MESVECCPKNNMTLTAAHIAGVDNVLADKLSRLKVRPTEWSLNEVIAHKIFIRSGSPRIDLFATIQNYKCPVFCSWDQNRVAYAQDAL